MFARKVPFPISQNRKCQRKRAFFTFRTQTLFAHFLNMPFLQQKITSTQNTIFCLFLKFPFSIFASFLFFLSPTQKRQKTKMPCFSPCFDTSTTCKKYVCTPTHYLVDVSDIFNFFLLGGGEGGVRGAGRAWGDFLWKTPGGGSPGWVGAGARGREVVCGELGGGGLNIFFWGRNVHRRDYHWGQNYYIPFFLFWGIIFGNYYRKLYSM